MAGENSSEKRCSGVSLHLCGQVVEKCGKTVYWPQTQFRCRYGVPMFALDASLNL